MGDQMVMERPIAILHAGVDAMGSVDPGEYSDTQLAGEVLRLRAEMDRLDAVFAGLVAVAHTRGVGTIDGYQSTAGWLRWQAGMRTGDVRSAIDAGALCDVLPETIAAWRAGQITTGAMRAIAAARVEGFDTELAAVEAEFLDAARRKDMWSLQRMTALFRACAQRDGDLPADRSGLRAAIVGDRLVLDGEIGGLAGETIQQVLNAFTDPPSPDDDRSLRQRRADALYRICRIALDSGVDANMGSLNAAVVIDWSTLVAHLAHKYSAETDQPAADEPTATVWVYGDGWMVGSSDRSTPPKSKRSSVTVLLTAWSSTRLNPDPRRSAAEPSGEGASRRNPGPKFERTSRQDADGRDVRNRQDGAKRITSCSGRTAVKAHPRTVYCSAVATIASSINTPTGRSTGTRPTSASTDPTAPNSPPGTTTDKTATPQSAFVGVDTLGSMTVHERPFGRYFEDFEPGDLYRHWPGKTITEYDDHLFCMITMNHHPLHTDAWYAETQTQFGKNVVVGNLVYSLVLGMSVPDVSGLAIANLEIETLQHKRPTFHGDTIYAETKVLEKKESSSKPDRGIVSVETFGYNQRGEEVCYFRRKVMVPKREAAKPRQRPYRTD